MLLFGNIENAEFDTVFGTGEYFAMVVCLNFRKMR